jgi:hypothetical protein
MRLWEALAAGVPANKGQGLVFSFKNLSVDVDVAAPEDDVRLAFGPGGIDAVAVELDNSRALSPQLTTSPRRVGL